MLRYALAPRWWFMHLVVAALFLGCLRLGWWQWQVSQTPEADEGGFGGHLRNAFYAFQWWFFAGFGLWFWGRFLRDQRAADAEYERRWWEEYEAGKADNEPGDAPGRPVDGSADSLKS